MNDFYQNLFNEEKIGYKTKLGDAVINEINKVSYHTIQKTDFKVIKEDFIINDQASYIYTLERVNINSVSPVLESALYDELVEINLTRDTYNILFYRKDKYIIPALSGSFSKQIREIAQKIIHPHDQNDFLQLFNKMKNNHGDFKPVMGRFRRLLNNGEYSWINGILIAISKGQFSDTVYMCLFQDGGLTPINVESTNYKEYDQTTGLLNEHSFLKAARFLLEEGGNDNYCLIAIDIEHFKLFNDWYGRQMGNKILGQIGLELQKIQNEFKTVAGYFGGDDFVVIMPNERPLIDKLLTDLIAHIKVVTVNPGFFPKFGIYIVIDGEYVAAMYDRALIALSSIKENYTKQIAYYDSNIRQDFEYSQSILMDTQQALYNHEFMVYFQPKCNMLNGKIVGVEALVRWNHPTKGIISPGDFVFILEKNGFIVNLDLFVWQETCRLLSNWLDQGNQGVPVSVNVSRTDIYAIDVVKTFKELVAEYKLPVNLIEIEITESSYASDYEIISKVVDDFRLAGFTVLMDDFGSGYSSLNMLKDVNVDILKIDMKFLELREDSIGRGIGILEAIVKMAKLMGLRVIAEGVETKQQIDLLNELSCIYGQGYYFYPPLSVQEFEAIISNSDLVDYRGIMLKQVDQVRLQDIYIK
jgi:EAL domain-containing protein (putative c-di-GMP-specific phosphodiesterase class I)